MLYLILFLFLATLAWRLAASLRRLWHALPSSNQAFGWDWR